MKIVQEKDACFAWLGNKNKPYYFIAKQNEKFTIKFGTFLHSDIIGKPYGTRVYPIINKAKQNKNKKRKLQDTFVFILPFTPELWTVSLPHRTQILYSADCSLIISLLGLKPGSLVAESGTGSTSLTHSIARIIQPAGILNTFEFNPQRAKLAVDDIVANGYKSVVNVECRDVIEKGFKGEKVMFYDAVFLDLPNPWEAIIKVKECLKGNGRVCSFSPCIEQVQETCKKLEEEGFYDIETYECIQREYTQQKIFYPTPKCFLNEEEKKQKGKVVTESVGTRPFIDIAGHTGYLTFATL
eukprot:snap_masked-scaffold_38-processed-gene-2.78-mRNA-1 protein AED:0.01 eAED:0.01 QI:0/-1/0/1/-1/1/1/0/297